MAKIRINGDTSGYIEISAPAVAGSTSITLPATTGGNFLVTDSSGNLNVDSGTLYVDATNNRVGIGTSSPTVPLEISATGAGIKNIINIKPGISTTGEGGAITFSNLDPGSNQLAKIASVFEGGTFSASLRFYTNTDTEGASPSEKMRITPAGRVGIGTTSPGGNSGTRLVLHDASTPRLRLTNSTTGEAASDGAELSLFNSDFIIENRESAPIIFYNGGGERARIDSSGRLLVGTSSSRGNTYNSASGNDHAVQIEGTSFGSASLSIVRNSNDGSPAHFTIGKTRGTSVGSNTVVQNGDLLARIGFLGADGSDLAEGAYIDCVVDGTPGNNDMPSRLVFSTTADGVSSPTQRVKITNAGYFKATTINAYVDDSEHEFINGTSNKPVLRLQSNASSGTQYGLLIRTINDQNDATRHFFQCLGDATERATIRSNGGLANYSANNVNLSDINTKKDISRAAGTWDCIKEWEIVNYRYKDQPDDADLNMGVIAQQVAESCPEVITVFEEAKDDQPEKLGIKEQQMYWMAIKALQEAQIRIEQLEAKVAALEAA